MSTIRVFAGEKIVFILVTWLSYSKAEFYGIFFFFSELWASWWDPVPSMWLLRAISPCQLCEILFQWPLKTTTALYCDLSGQLHVFPVLTIFHFCCFHFLLASAKSSSVPHAFFSWTCQTRDHYYSEVPSFPAHLLRFIKWLLLRHRVFISCELGFHSAPAVIGEHFRQSWHSPRLRRFLLISLFLFFFW